MQHTLYLFNPENDLALANGDENYVAPASARKMAVDLALLPFWYAEENACILVPSSSGITTFVNGFKSFFIRKELVYKENMCCVGFDRIVPWGWNPGLVKQLRMDGISDSLLPSREQMNKIRELSHRSLSVSLLNKLKAPGNICGASTELYHENELIQYIEDHPSVILKAPWSGSGKGLFFCNGEFTYPAQQWCKRVMHSQKCVIGEPFYDKVEDFAMEFFSDGQGEVIFSGYSFFHTDKRGSYKGNVLASDKYIEKLLADYVPLDALHSIRKHLLILLSVSIGPYYRGYLGVDMMICRFGQSPEYRIHPCVEVNLRMNMGMVSRLIHDKYISSDKVGHFSIAYASSSEELIRLHRMKKKAHPLLVDKGQIISGYMALTPIGVDTRYVAEVFVG